MVSSTYSFGSNDWEYKELHSVQLREGIGVHPSFRPELIVLGQAFPVLVLRLSRLGLGRADDPLDPVLKNGRLVLQQELDVMSTMISMQCGRCPK